jgi:hypothetical protein
LIDFFVVRLMAAHIWHTLAGHFSQSSPKLRPVPRLHLRHKRVSDVGRFGLRCFVPLVWGCAINIHICLSKSAAVDSIGAKGRRLRRQLANRSGRCWHHFFRDQVCRARPQVAGDGLRFAATLAVKRL